MRTLVLNAGYEPLAVVSFKRALALVMNERPPWWNTPRPIRCGAPDERMSALP